ncbi:MAG: hypothetical protein WDO18_13255 [Acidobacteriota bacterium]
MTILLTWVDIRENIPIVKAFDVATRTLLDRVFSESHFRQGSKAESLLKRLSESESATVHELAQALYKEALPSDGGVNGVRTLVSRVRAELRKFGNENPDEQTRIDIGQVHGGGYRLMLIPNYVTPGGGDDTALLSWLWGACGTEPVLEISSRVFIATDDGEEYYRDVTKQQGGDLGAIGKKLGKKVRYMRHYVSAGETLGLLQLVDLFLGLPNCRPQFGNLPKYARSPGGANLILVGLPNSTSNHELFELIQGGGEGYRLTPKGVEAQQAEGKGFKDTSFSEGARDPYVDNAKEVATKYVILTRRPNSNPVYSLTAITSTHGRATAAVCKFLSEGAGVAKLREELKAQNTREAPDHFQTIFAVRLARYSGGDKEIVVDIKIETTWWPDRAEVPAESPDLIVTV